MYILFKYLSGYFSHLFLFFLFLIFYCVYQLVFSLLEESFLRRQVATDYEGFCLVLGQLL